MPFLFNIEIIQSSVMQYSTPLRVVVNYHEWIISDIKQNGMEYLLIIVIINPLTTNIPII